MPSRRSDRGQALEQGYDQSQDWLTAQAQALRGWEEENLGKSLALSFVPGVGQVYGGVSTAAALQDPTASGTEKAVAVAGAVLPIDKLVNLAKKFISGGKQVPDWIMSQIDVYHSSPHKYETPRNAPSGEIGSLSGPGHYAAEHADDSTQFARGKGYLYKREIPDEHLGQYVDIQQYSTSYKNIPDNIKESMKKLYPGLTVEEAFAKYKNSNMAGRADSSYELEKARQRALAAGLRGNKVGDVYVTFDPNDYNLKERYEIDGYRPQSKDRYRRNRPLEEVLGDVQIPDSPVVDLSNAPKSPVPEASRELRKMFEEQMSKNNLSVKEVMSHGQIKDIISDSLPFGLATRLPFGSITDLADGASSEFLAKLMKQDPDAMEELRLLAEAMQDAAL